eukprot:GHVT01103853.1.p1 GENE.GHVT01103853.1~~GHVT01103853.1.p1  ORF type:complete len:140 (+),score=12.66 GHVT01103853.1:411-830(+)
MKKKIAPNDLHRKLRFEFCQKYKDWRVEDWQKIIFLDECNVDAEPGGGLQKVWRKPSEKNAAFPSSRSTVGFGKGLKVQKVRFHASHEGRGEFHYDADAQNVRIKQNELKRDSFSRTSTFSVILSLHSLSSRVFSFNFA